MIQILMALLLAVLQAGCEAPDYLEARNEIVNEGVGLREFYGGKLDDNSLNAQTAFEAAMDFAEVRRDMEDLDAPDCAAEDQRLLAALWGVHQDYYLAWFSLLAGIYPIDSGDDLINPLTERTDYLFDAIMENAAESGWDMGE